MGILMNYDYLAGFIDGEGSIALYKHKDSRVQKGYTLHPKFLVSNTNEVIIKAIQKEIGGKIKSMSQHKGCKIVQIVEFQDYKQIKSILEKLLPLLIIKQPQARLMIEFCENRIKSSGKKYTERDYEIAEIFSNINKRGD